ncbi:MAG: pyridoxal phosphate-dependent aminotransferase [Proteobacteria bacterium]|nr:pyridoxal phosphate-dependent aminotransferase [Pseudomonadota bacterium]
MATKRTEDMTSFIVMDVLEKAHDMERQGIEVIHLEVGEPDFPTPSCVKDALVRALDDDSTHYTHSLGIIELREAICEHYFETYGVHVSPDRVVVTSGTSPAMLSLFSVLIEQDDEVIISDPHYACYPNFIRFSGGVPVRVRVNERDGFQLMASDIQAKITEKTRAIFINSPSNPMGTVLSKENMMGIAGLGPIVISDEIYHGLVYEGKEHSILEFTENAFVLNGFSKLHAMTGMRLGYMIAPLEYMDTLQKVQQNFFISANAMVQKAGISALKDSRSDTDRMRTIYNERRIYMIKRLRHMGFTIPVEPTGAFYVFVNARHISEDSYKLAFDILEKAHVGVTPGIDFGPGGEGFLRFSYANSLENIEKGMDRLERYLGV